MTVTPVNQVDPEKKFVSKHTIVSVCKSAARIVGYGLAAFAVHALLIPIIILVIAEVIGVVEEMV